VGVFFPEWNSLRAGNRVDLQRRDGFFQGAEDSGEIGWGRWRDGIGRGSRDGQDEEFVAGAAGEAGVLAAGGEDAGGDRAAIRPMEVDVLEKEVARRGGRG
jgi:hypothetical protein